MVSINKTMCWHHISIGFLHVSWNWLFCPLIKIMPIPLHIFRFINIRVQGIKCQHLLRSCFQKSQDMINLLKMSLFEVTQAEKTALTLPLQYQSYRVLSPTARLQSSLDNSGCLLILAPLLLCPAPVDNWLESVWCIGMVISDRLTPTLLRHLLWMLWRIAPMTLFSIPFHWWSFVWAVPQDNFLVLQSCRLSI